jgi:chorismate mutase
MEIKSVRKEIDSIDDEIISLLSKRKGMSQKIAEIKKQSDKPILDQSREQQVMKRLKKLSKEKGLDENFIISLYNIILKNSRDEQKNQD